MTVQIDASDYRRRMIVDALDRSPMPPWAEEFDLSKYGEKAKSDEHFADGAGRQLPLGSKQDVWLSAALLYNAPAPIPGDWDSRVLKAAEWFQVLPEIEAVKTAAETHRGQLPDDAFALVEIDEDGAKRRSLPLRSPADVRAAEGWLKTNAERLPLAVRSKIAGRVLDRADAFDVPLDDREAVEIASARYLAAPESRQRKVAAAIMDVRDVATRQELREVHAIVGNDLPLDHALKLAEILPRNRGVDPLQGLFGPRPATKAAAPIRFSVTGGATYALSDLDGVTYADVARALGEKKAGEIAGEIGEILPAKLAEAAGRFSQAEATLFSALLEERTGVPTVFRSSVEPLFSSLSADEVRQLASHAK